MTRFQTAALVLLAIAALGTWLQRPAAAEDLATSECAAFTLPDTYWASRESTRWLKGMKEQPFSGGRALPPGWTPVGGGANSGGQHVIACR